MWDELRSFMMPKMFFSGVLLGLIVCTAAGRYCASRNPYENFRRFHSSLSAETFFFATVSQMVAMINEALAQGKIVVVVGGNSIAEGRGQGKELWTTDLQTRLGPSYKVLNLAQSGMPSFTGPYIAFLSLALRHQDLYYVAVAQPLYANGVETPFVGYSYWWDAHYKGLLPYYRRLDEYISERIKVETVAEKEILEECQIEERLDSIFYFKDLWSTLAYKSFFTVWTKPTANTFMAPRKIYPDEEPSPLEPVAHRFDDLNLEFERRDALRDFDTYFETNTETKKRQFSKQMLDWYKYSIDATVPEQLRSQVLLIDVRKNPLVLSRILNEEEFGLHEQVSELSVKLWEGIGVSALYVGKDFKPDDYLDGCHLTGPGGAKLSAAVASKIFEMQQINSQRKFRFIQR